MAGAEEGPVQRAGPLFAKLTQIMNTHLGMERDGTGIDIMIGQLTELQSAVINYTLMITLDYSIQNLSKRFA